MAHRILNLRELNRATLSRQMLLERESLSAPTAIERLVGMQAQLASAPYIGLWTRLRDFKREDLAGPIEKRKVIKATFMRNPPPLLGGRLPAISHGAAAAADGGRDRDRQRARRGLRSG